MFHQQQISASFKVRGACSYNVGERRNLIEHPMSHNYLNRQTKYPQTILPQNGGEFRELQCQNQKFVAFLYINSTS